MKLLPDTDTEVLVEIGKSQARFVFGDIDFLTKLVEGKFPDYNRFLRTTTRRSLSTAKN